jgi:CspA family cold shock protein
MNIKSGINWTRSVIALALLCAVFSFGAMAQSDPNEPLDAEAAAALVQELSDGLPDLIGDEAQVTAITEKWEAHEDLAGKTKLQILELLFEDVKSVATDQETQDKIWKSWTEEKESEDETPAETPQKPVAPPVEKPQAPAAPPVSAPAKPVIKSHCRPQNATIKSNQAERVGFISVGYRPSFATGTVRCFDEKYGFGYITQDGDGTDIFVHHSSINMDGVRTLQEGQKVQFEILIGPKGQRTAVNVRTA